VLEDYHKGDPDQLKGFTLSVKGAALLCSWLLGSLKAFCIGFYAFALRGGEALYPAETA